MAADQGDSTSQYMLGYLYDAGQGVPQDYVQAAQWYLKAANQGNSDAQFNLAVDYHNGQGVARDDVQAYKWLEIAKDSAPQGSDGYNRLNSALDSLTTLMTSAQIADAQQAASTWQAKKQRK
jgi:TPR repeat protein